MSAHTNLDVALRYAAAGFKIFPCGTDKRPLVPSWAAEATTGPERIRAWWAAHPDALIGLPMKPHDLLTFDADRHSDTEDGVTHFHTLCAEHEALPPHPIVLTANGGEHHIFRQPAEKIGNRKLGNGLETRGYKDDNDGGYIIAAGSRLPDGRLWRRANGAPSLLGSTVVDPPKWLAEHAREKPREESYQSSVRTNTKREESYAVKALDNLAHDLAAMAPETGRNDRLNVAALKLGSMVGARWIGEATVSGRLFDACVANGLVKDTSAKAVNATIRSGLTAGLAQPHADLPNREQPPEREAAKSDPSTRSTTWRDGLITAAALRSKQFKPVRIILPGLIPEGVTIVAGKPKVGKSWLALDVCLAVGDENRFVLGDKRPVHGDALYLALEDNERRLKKRIDKIVQAGAWPTGLELHTEWKRMDHGGLEDIEAWITSVENPRLIWVDTLAKIRPILGRNEQAYAADYRAIEGLQKLSGQYGVGVVLNHHLRKMSSEEDAFDDVSGTLGLTGAADTIIVMKRHSGMMKIFVRGRDIEEAEFAAEFNRDTCRWRLVGGAEEVFRSQERQAILAVLKDTKRPMSVPELMAATDRSDRHAISNLLYKMEKAGEIKHAGRGLWAHPSSSVGFVGNGQQGGSVDGQAVDNAPNSDGNGIQRGIQRESNGGVESVGFGVGFRDSTKPLTDKGKASESNESNESNGSEHAAAAECLGRAPNGGSNGGRPPRGPRWHQVGDNPPGEAGATVWVKEVWPPALGPPGDDLLDIDPEWGRP
jgi:hypothetical protein